MENSEVEYVDLRIGITPSKWRWMNSMSDGLEVFAEELSACYGLSVSFLAAVNLTKSLKDIDEIFEALQSDKSIYTRFVGIDINMLPADLSKLKRYAPIIQDIQSMGKKVNMHLGEIFSNHYAKEILSYVRPDRIGHGVLLLNDDELVRYIRQHDICLDMCPTSNTLLGVVDWKRENPWRKAIRLGVPATINTDDPLLFNTHLDQEISLTRLHAKEIERLQAIGKKYAYKG